MIGYKIIKMIIQAYTSRAFCMNRTSYSFPKVFEKSFMSAYARLKLEEKKKEKKNPPVTSVRPLI